MYRASRRLPARKKIQEKQTRLKVSAHPAHRRTLPRMVASPAPIPRCPEPFRSFDPETLRDAGRIHSDAAMYIPCRSPQTTNPADAPCQMPDRMKVRSRAAADPHVPPRRQDICRGRKM